MSVVTAPNYGFTFGALNLLGTDTDISTYGYKFTTQGTDGDFGNPVPIEQAVISWLQDGAIVALQGYDNREVYLKVSVDANDGIGLARGEQALMLETGKTNMLTYHPADPTAAASVFDVVISYLELVTDGAYEKSQTRTYGLRITALPTTRSQDLVEVTIPAPSGSQTITTVDACSSTTGWAFTQQVGAGSPSSGTLSTSGGRVRGVTLTKLGFPVNLTLTRSGLSVSLSGTPYLRLDVSGALSIQSAWPTGAPVFAFHINGVAAPVVVQSGNVYWLDATGVTTLVSVAISTQANIPKTQESATLTVGDVSRSNVLGDQNTTPRELPRTVTIAGSARAQGNLAIVDATDALGLTMVHTMPTVSGMVQPNLRVWLTSANTQTPDAATVSGDTSDLTDLHTFDIPASGFVPGGHLLVARIMHTSSGVRSMAWAARGRMGSTDLPGGESGTTDVTLEAGVYSVVTLASLNLPPRKLGVDGLVRIELTGTSSMVLDEAWLFNIETGRLTLVECGADSPAAGGSANRLWLDAPTLESPSPAVYLGTASDRSDAYHAATEMSAFGNHEFVPPSMNVFTVTTNSLVSEITLSHHPRWHTHAVT